GGVVVIPSFALERTQEVLYLLRQLSLKGVLKKIPVYLDAPLAINVTKTFLNYPKLFSNEIQKLISENKNPFDFEELVHTESKSASKAIAHKAGAKIIIAGSGMCEGGRVQNHLLRYLGDNNAMVLFVGYQVPGTLGHQIIHKKTVEIGGNKIVKNALIRSIDGFSAHADRDDLVEWVEGVKDVENIYLIHGDKERMRIFTKQLSQKVAAKIKIVKMHKKIEI
ncbi:MAG: MBL fold metallo-hydrolase RNA specificity domain-containing protein, partial [Campylobacterota bacterium]